MQKIDAQKTIGKLKTYYVDSVVNKMAAAIANINLFADDKELLSPDLTGWEELKESFEEVAGGFIEAINLLTKLSDVTWHYEGVPKEDNYYGFVGIVNGKDGNNSFEDAVVLLDYDFKEKEWVSLDYNISNLEVKCWMPVPEELEEIEGGKTVDEE